MFRKISSLTGNSMKVFSQLTFSTEFSTTFLEFSRNKTVFECFLVTATPAMVFATEGTQFLAILTSEEPDSMGILLMSIYVTILSQHLEALEDTFSVVILCSSLYGQWPKKHLHFI